MRAGTRRRADGTPEQVVIHSNDGLRKRCGCRRATWAKCPHGWYLNFMWRGVAHRVSVDKVIGKRVTTRGDAEAAADTIRNLIRDGKPLGQARGGAGLPIGPSAVTLAAACDRFLQGVPVLRGKRQGEARGGNDRAIFGRLCRAVVVEGGPPLGTWPVGTLTEDVLEAFLTSLRRAGLAVSTVNKYVDLIKGLDRWLARKGYRPARVIHEDSAVFKRGRHARRSRRLAADVWNDRGQLVTKGEERRLLAVASPWLQRIIIAALETGARKGELLALRWADVSLPRRELTIRAETAKDGETRHVPISDRLAAVLEMIRTDADGKDRAATAAVFGDETGAPIGEFRKTWETAVLKAHDVTPTWVGGGKQRLTAAARAALQRIGLRFHDLRHEAASRRLEEGWPLHLVQAWLGHADLTTTGVYLNAARVEMQAAMRRVDQARAAGSSGKVCTSFAQTGPIERPPTVQTSVQESREVLVN